MTEMNRYNDYNDFAWFYNRFWSERLIRQIFGTIEDHLLSKLKPSNRILDICCGNGHLAKMMTEKGFVVTGIDGSDEMIRYSRENSPTSEFQIVDAQEFEFEPVFDAATSTCDSFNHIMSIDELRRTFTNAYNAIKPGGYFLFDLNNLEGYHKYWKGESHGKVDDDCALVIKFLYNEDSKIATIDSAFFRLIDSIWRRTDLHLTQRYYPPEEVLAMLEDIGFKDIEMYDVEKDLGVEGTGRNMFVMRKG
ncbi:MAG: class I SAM-dependent methyltransferase [candidate division Zixibacteria bacterium]